MDSNNLNNNQFKIETIVNAINDICLSCIGVTQIADQVVNKKFLAKGKLDKGIQVIRNKDNSISVSVYLVMTKGIKITESLRECQKKIRYILVSKYNQKVRNIDLYATSLNLNQ